MIIKQKKHSDKRNCKEYEAKNSSGSSAIYRQFDRMSRFNKAQFSTPEVCILCQKLATNKKDDKRRRQYT